jgi:hypothetical protein
MLVSARTSTNTAMIQSARERSHASPSRLKPRKNVKNTDAAIALSTMTSEIGGNCAPSVCRARDKRRVGAPQQVGKRTQTQIHECACALSPLDVRSSRWTAPLVATRRSSACDSAPLPPRLPWHQTRPRGAVVDYWQSTIHRHHFHRLSCDRFDQWFTCQSKSF